MAEVVKQQASEKVQPCFPDDVLIEILLKLPVRSLVSFKSVSKHWYALLQSPNFISLHLKRSLINTHPSQHSVLILLGVKPVLQLRTRLPKDSFVLKLISTLISDDETLTYKDQVSLEALSPSIADRGLQRFRNDNLRLLGPCNGLFCMTDRDDIVVFNPAIRQCTEVPRSPLSSPSNKEFHGDFILCFGYDSITNDYKVVQFRKVDENEFGDYVEIFSLSTNTWTEVDCVVPSYGIHPLCNHDLFFNGAFHWVGLSSDYIRLIVVFDLNKETFNTFELPDKFPNCDPRKMYLSVLNECFTIIVNRVRNRWYPTDEVEIWAMEEYGVYNSWTKLYNINTGIVIRRSLSFYKDGEFVFEDNHGWLVSFNFNTKVIKKIKVDGLLMSALMYRESLVSPWRS